MQLGAKQAFALIWQKSRNGIPLEVGFSKYKFYHQLKSLHDYGIFKGHLTIGTLRNRHGQTASP